MGTLRKCSLQGALVLVALLAMGWHLAHSTQIICAYMHQDPVKEMSNANSDGNDRESDSATKGEILPGNKTMRCPKKTDFCYALWLEDPNNRSEIMLAQGCWESSGKDECDHEECISRKKPSKAWNTTKFCCCKEKHCNINVTDAYIPTSEEPEQVHPAYPYVEHDNDDTQTVIIVVAVVGILLIMVALAFIGYHLWAGVHKPNPDLLHLIEAPQPPEIMPVCDLTTLKCQEIIGRGRYGSVWKATLNGQEVAVKVFQSQHRPYYLNEKDIYTLPHFEHSSLLKYLGSDERINADGRTEYLIVLSYTPLGCLQDHLRSHVIDWATLCKMNQSIAKGLAHLHVDVRKGDKVKPCVTHRDLNSRNILVKNDLSCCICDMGFAMKIAGSKYYGQNGEEQIAETTSLNDVGTLRYMAPEVLEGAVNLRDCESSLKQIDVYALGLMFWEIMTRCEDLYQGLEVPDYKLPFEAEIGLHPTFEQMQVLISRNKARPLFSEVWKDSNQAVRLLKETVEDCWDQDAEARLTSLCVDERLQELPVLWERHKASIVVTGVSPTVNLTSQVTSLRNPQNSNVPRVMSNGNITNVTHVTTSSSAGDRIDRNINITNGSTSLDINSLPNQNRNSYNHNRESSVSEATLETTVTMSPSEPSTPATSEISSKNANIQQVAARVSNIPLQPYQGRNPCIERNMIMEPLEEVSISGNTLLEKGNKYKSSSVSNHRDLDMDNIFDVLQMNDNVESNSLVTNDVLNHSTSRPCNPIPYVQNTIHDTVPTRPKQPNVPGNGYHYDKKTKKGPFGGRFERKKGTQSEQGASKNKNWGFRSFLDRKKSSRNNQPAEEFPRPEPLVIQNHNPNDLQHIKSNLHVKAENVPQPVPVEAYLEQSMSDNNHVIVTRPAVGPYKSIENGYISNGLCRTAEVGVAHLSPTKLQNGQAPIVKCRYSNHSGSSQSSSGLSNCLSESDLLDPNVDSKLKRPNTLPLKNNKGNHSANGDIENFHVRQSRTSQEGTQSEKKALLEDTSNAGSSIDAEDEKRLKIQKRVKTPFKMKSGRFSLYDDRMMFQNSESCLTISIDPSLQHARECVSMPVNINENVYFSPDSNEGAPCSSNTEDKNISRSNIVNSAKSATVKPCMNGTVLLNSSLPHQWINSDGHSRTTDNSSESTYQISCL